MNTFTVLSFLALGSCIAVAQDGAPRGDGGGRLAEFLKKADTDSDGKISKAEFDEFSKRDMGDRFSKMDQNADGFVDPTEMSQIAEKMREGMKGRAGGEGGGFRRPPADAPERGKSMPKPEGDRPMPRPEGDRPQGDRPPGDRPQGGPPGGPSGFNLDDVYGRMDKNADGSVDKEEYTEYSKQEIESRFTRMDENTDGKVSKEEMKTAMERMRNMMRGGQGGPGGPPGGQGGPGGMRRPSGEGGEGFRRPGGGGEGGGFRRPPAEGDAAKKDPA